MNREPLRHEEIRQIVRRVLAGEDRKDIAATYRITRSTISNYMRRYDLRREGHTERGTNRYSDHSWMEAAACIDPDTRLPRQDWVKTGRTRKGRKYAYFTEWHTEQQAKVCRDCPVQDQCRDWGRQFSTGDATWARGTGPVFGGIPVTKLRKVS